MNTLIQDLRYGLRMLAKSPGVTAIAVLTLALGIGANTAIFSVINSVLLQPLPFKDPSHLVDLRVTENAPGSFPLTGADYLDWQEQNHTFAAMSLYSYDQGVSAGNSNGSDPAAVVDTQANFFSNLGVQPLLGRTFAPGEDVQGKNHVAILNYTFWQRHFGGTANVIGQSIRLNEEPYTIIGIMPPWFNFPPAIDIWRPLDMSPKNLGGRGNHLWRALGRVKTGTSIAQARADLVALSERISKQYRSAEDIQRAIVTPLKERLTRDTKTPLILLLAAVGMVLLVACANVANLMLARSTSRIREIAVRASLGASQWRLIRQLLTESILLSVLGAALGLVGAWWGVDALQSAATLPLPRANPIQVNMTVLLFTLSVSVLVGVLFGLAPALQVSALDMGEELKSISRAVVSASGWRRIMRDTLVVGEIAASLALLVGAGLLLRSFAKMRGANIGVQTKNVLTLGINLASTRYSTPERCREFVDQFVERVNHIPGVEAAAVADSLPVEGGSNGYIKIQADMNPALAKQLVEWNNITPDYFHTFGIPLLKGRNFSPADLQQVADANSRLRVIFESAKNPDKVKIPSDLRFVAVINRTMAQAFWPKQDPVGKSFAFSEEGPWVTIIGIADDVKERGIASKTAPGAYFPITNALDGSAFSGYLVVRTSVPATNILTSIRSTLRDMDSSLAVFRPRTMDEVVADNMQNTSLQTLLLGIFAGLALLLAAVGIYGVMAYLVMQRTHEIGLRMALGAQRRSVLQLIMGQGAKLTLIGVAIGLAAALGLTRLMAALLYGVSATDPLTFIGVAILLSIVALSACYVPARRAMHVEPMEALRYE